MSDLIDTTEMYLRTIYELEEEGVVALRARIAERLGHSGPTVSQTVARMERDGLLHVSGDRHLELTPLGRSKATRVMRKHRLAERLLLDVIGLEWEFVHDEACRWEHVMSDRVEKKLLAMLSHPMESPYGNPIPGLDELDDPQAAAGSAPGQLEEAETPTHVPSDLMSLPDALATAADGSSLKVRRLGERLQMNTELMRRLADAGIGPGTVVDASRAGNRILVRPATVAAATPGTPAGGTAVADAGVSLELPPDVARHVFVESVA